MQAMIAEAAAYGQADLDLVSVDSTTARAHHHAAGMALDPEHMKALEEAADQEKGLRQRGKTPTTANPMKVRKAIRPDADGYGCDAGYG